MYNISSTLIGNKARNPESLDIKKLEEKKEIIIYTVISYKELNYKWRYSDWDDQILHKERM